MPLPLRPALEAPEVAAFRAKWGPETPAVARATATGVCAALPAPDAAPAGNQSSANGRRDASPELVVAMSLAAADRPQDSYVLLRALGATLAHLEGVA
jgi:hypothetical protein